MFRRELQLQVLHRRQVSVGGVRDMLGSRRVWSLPEELTAVRSLQCPMQECGDGFTQYRFLTRHIHSQHLNKKVKCKYPEVSQGHVHAPVYADCPTALCL